MPAPVLATPRLRLRPWMAADLAPFAAMNADPRVRAHFPGLLTRTQSDEAAARIAEHLTRRGFGLWALEVPGVAPFIGFAGLSVPGFAAHFTPCVEIGWRLAHPYWGFGYASEAARAALTHGFDTLGLEEIVSFTIPANHRSIAVMQRVGMSRSPTDDFLHPDLPDGHPMRLHVLYRLARAAHAAAALPIKSIG
jgi:ribosomal-protein-alanine N-acetyltransferase